MPWLPRSAREQGALAADARHVTFANGFRSSHYSALAVDVGAARDVEGLALVGDNHERLRRPDRGLAVLGLGRRELAVASATDEQRGENQACGDGRRPPGSNAHNAAPSAQPSKSGQLYT